MYMRVLLAHFIHIFAWLKRLADWLTGWLICFSQSAFGPKQHNTNTLLHLAYNILNQMNEWMEIHIRNATTIQIQISLSKWVFQLLRRFLYILPYVHIFLFFVYFFLFIFCFFLALSGDVQCSVYRKRFRYCRLLVCCTRINSVVLKRISTVTNGKKSR